MIRIVAVALVLGIGLLACDGTRSVISTAPVDDGTLVCADGTGLCHDDGLSVGSTNLASQHGEGIEIAPLQPGPDGSLPSGLVIYFDYDSSDIRSDFNEILRAHGTYLVENRARRVILVGHADDSGSPEYNIGLGEQRAHSVHRALLLYGASVDQVGTVSNGKEGPKALGSDETRVRPNRRVELVYR